MLVESSQPGALARRLAALPRGARGARPRRRDRRRDDRDGALRRLRAARGEPVREVGGDVLQPRVPAQHLPPARAAARAAARDAARAGDLLAPDARARRRSTTRRSSRCARPRRAGRAEFAAAFGAAAASDPRIFALRPTCCYETLGPTLPDGARGAAALWGLAHRCAMTYPDAVRRAGHADGEALFDAILAGRSGIAFTRRRVRGRLELRRPSGQPARARDPGAARRSSPRSARRRTAGRATSSRSCSPPGERRYSTANTIIRDPRLAQARRRRRAAHQPAGRPAPRASPTAGRRAITTARGSPRRSSRSATRCSPGHVSLPNGLGVDYPGEDGEPVRPASRRTSSRRWTGATRSPARRGTSTCRRGSRRWRRRRDSSIARRHEQVEVK